jgi:PKD repeat protein
LVFRDIYINAGFLYTQYKAITKIKMIDENSQNPTQQPSEKPINPELEAVQANEPEVPKAPVVEKPVKGSVKTKPTVLRKPAAVASQTGQPPKKIGAEKKKPSAAKFLIGCAGGFIILFVIFVILMVLMMSRVGADNPVMRAFGLDPSGLKVFLLTVINLAFGALSLLFFVLVVISVFRLLAVKKGDKEAKNKWAKMTVFSLTPFVLMVFIWFVLYAFISRVQIAAEQVIAEIIVAQPEDLTALQAPVEITFSAEHVAKALIFGGLDIESMAWDLDGDGSFETPIGAEPEVVHLYNRRGAYEIGLQVKIAGEETPRVYTKLISIEEAVFGAEPETGYAPLDVQFDASGLVPKGFKVSSLDWDFDGNGKYDIEGPDNLRPTYTFEQIGTYNVHLRVIDQQNNVENYFRKIDIIPSDQPLLNAVINAVPATAGPIPLNVRFDGEQSSSIKGKIINYEWDFGDGSDLQTGKSVSHIFNNPGVYTVTLTVEEDSGRTASGTIEITAGTVSSVPEAAIKTNPVYDSKTATLTGVLPFKVEFDASDSTDADNDIVDYKWDFNGDNQTDQEGKKVTYTFEQSGSYMTALTVTDSQNQSANAVITVTVEQPGVAAVINADPEEGTAPLVVQFDGSSSSTFEGNIVSYEWDFGDASPKTITGATISHKYNDVGNYVVKLKVLTNKNESAETSLTIYVREIPLRACFTPSRYNGEAPLAVTFDPKCSTGAVFKFSWDFGDGETSDSRKPTHTFEFPGNYTVTLEVADEKNNVSAYSEVIVAQGELTQ